MFEYRRDSAPPRTPQEPLAPLCNSALVSGGGGRQCLYTPFAGAVDPVAAAQGSLRSRAEALHSGEGSFVRDSVRLLGEAVAVLEGVRVLSAQLFRWLSELVRLLRPLSPATAAGRLGRWAAGLLGLRGAERSLRKPETFENAWSEATSAQSGRLTAAASGEAPKATQFATLSGFSAALALALVAVELFLHVREYRSEAAQVGRRPLRRGSLAGGDVAYRSLGAVDVLFEGDW